MENDTRLTKWLELMLGEIARKKDDAARARDEQARREAERAATPRPVAPPPGR